MKPSTVSHARVTGLRRAAALVSVTALVLAVGACSGDEEPSGGGADSTVSIAESEPDALIPGQTSGAALDIVNSLFAPLVKFDANDELVLVQAESITTTDNLVWTITIKPGWTFHNGEPVTAQSYVDSWNHTAYGPNGWAQNYLFAKVQGYAELNPAEGEPAVKELSGAEVIDDTTIRLTLNNPDSQLKFELAVGLGWLPLPEAAFEDLEAYNEAPIGNGPFRMDGTWEHNVGINLARWEDYQGPSSKIDTLQFKIYSTAEAAYTDAVAGNLDIPTGGLLRVAPSKLATLSTDFPDRVATKASVEVFWLGFPSWDSRYDDIRLRQAVSMSIDRQAIADAIFAGLYEPATGMISPGSFGGASTACGDICAFDPDAANALLAEAGGFSGSMELAYTGGPGQEPYMQAIANQIRQNLGIEDVSLKAYPDGAQFGDALFARELQGPFSAAWASPTATPLDIMAGLFQETSFANAYSGYYNDPEVDRLIAQASASTDSDEITALFLQADEKIMSDLPVAPMLFPQLVVPYSARIAEPVMTIIGVDPTQLEVLD